MRDSLNRELEREFIFNHVLSVGENKPFKLNNISPLSEGEWFLWMNEKFKTTGKEIIKKGDEYIVISKDDKKDFSKISKAIEEISEVLRVSLLAKKDLENQINNSINLLIELTRRFIQEKKED